MDKTQVAKHLLKQGWRWHEIAPEVDADLMTIYRNTKLDRRLSCTVCGGFFDYIKKRFRYCGFTCWASCQISGKNWDELKEEYKYLST